MEITLIDHMGDDLRVVNSARVSFHKESEWQRINEKIKSEVDIEGRSIVEWVECDLELTEQDQKLIKYLATHNHWTPFSHVQITMREKVPIFVARQRFKHMVGFTYNEVSRRYVSDEPEFYIPDVWRSKPEGSIKQGSGDNTITELELDEHVVWDDITSPKLTTPIKETYEMLVQHAQQIYRLMIDNGVAPEQARMVLPQSLYTEYYVSGSLPAWARAYKLRSDGHAQKEIRDLADMWNEKISGIEQLKYSWKALTQS